MAKLIIQNYKNKPEGYTNNSLKAWFKLPEGYISKL